MTERDMGGEFRQLHYQPTPLITPNPWDIGSARMLAAKGFRALASTSSGLAFASGKPEGSLSRDEVFRHCRALIDSVSIPVSADLQDGYAAGLDDVRETYRLAGAIGLAGASIEDANSAAESQIYGFEEAVERVVASVDAVRSMGRDFVLTARCENYLFGRKDLADTIRRLQAFQEAGADVLFAPGLISLADIQSVVSSVDRPVNVIVGLKNTQFSLRELADIGVRRISVGSALFRLAFGAAVTAADEMLREGSFAFAASAMPFSEINALYR